MSACNFFEVEPHIITSDQYYKTEDDVLHGLAGVYGVMSNEGFYGKHYTFDCSYVDDLCYVNRPPEDVAEVMNVYGHNSSTAELQTVWTEIYEGIKNANAFMNAVSKTEFDKDKALYHEARFLRAYYHFLLAQAWGNIPLRKEEVTSAEKVECEATSQYEALLWVAEEMEACIGYVNPKNAAPSRVIPTTIQGILARVYLFMAGESVEGGDKKEFYRKAMEYSEAVITSQIHKLNPDYTQVFKNMISDEYDRTHCESMWEVEFVGARESAERWTNGRIGDVNGLQNTKTENYKEAQANYSEGRYNGSLKLWDLYWSTDTINYAANDVQIDDSRLEWNIPPYNYDSTKGLEKSGIVYLGVNALTQNPITARAIRNVGKFRREVEYEGNIGLRMLYTGINFPILRYSDVLLMYAEASYEYNETVSQTAYDCLLAVRERALGVGKTHDFSHYIANPEEFRQCVRNERGRELCFEGTRKYDLIRWGIFVECMNDYAVYAADKEWYGNSGLADRAAKVGSRVNEKHILQPIPLSELATNTKLKQNPLW